MRKTILTVVAALMLVATGVAAENSADVTDVTVNNTTLNADLSSFCKAIVKGDLEMVKRMIELGEDVNKKSLGMTPAIFAARYNKAEILEVLIANGANLKIKSDKGYTAKYYAELSNAKDALAVIEAAMKR
ncbi:ankyrin repeat domain-containing protein [Flavobacteriaceae bacterium 3-367]|uniref:ankyrin repeat domain-containing protein n=1 Tax=Eudoraea algarum TaxID=3417568 RepID=UPI0032937056